MINAEKDDVVALKTYLSQSAVHPGKSFRVAFKIDIAPGWHINAPEPGDEFLIPSELFFEEDETVEVLKLHYPEPGRESFAYSQQELLVYRGEVFLAAEIRVKKDVSLKKHVLKASFIYQPCDSRTCMPPKKLEIKIPFSVVPSSKKVKQINEKIFSKIKF
ncbi:MAG: protein-disulfide reductase DsbD domain-containing protein [Candidatus Aminicenantales bacterium]